MNVLRVIASMDPAMGGPCQGIRNSIPELQKLGINNEVVCFDPIDSLFIKNDGFPVHALGQPKTPWAYNSRLLPWLEENLDKFDVVVIHGLWLYHGYGTLKAIKKYKQQKGLKKLRLYVMPHGMLDPYFQKAAGRKIKAIRNWLYWKLIEQKLVHAADGIFFTSQEELRLARTSFSPYHPQKELNIGYGIASPPAYTPGMEADFKNLCPGLSSGYWLFISRIHPKKGVDLLIDAYQRLKEEHRNLPALVIAGPGMDTPYGKMIREQAAGDSNIFFPGMLTGNAKWGAFYHADVFVLPSHQENFGIAVVEAMACGIPVLITNKVNIYREILEHKAGLVEDDDREGIYRLLKKWYDLDTAEKKYMKDQASGIFSQLFSAGGAAAKMAVIFRQGVE